MGWLFSRNQPFLSVCLDLSFGVYVPALKMFIYHIPVEKAIHSQRKGYSWYFMVVKCMLIEMPLLIGIFIGNSFDGICGRGVWQLTWNLIKKKKREKKRRVFCGKEHHSGNIWVNFYILMSVKTILLDMFWKICLVRLNKGRYLVLFESCYKKRLFNIQIL